MAAGQHNVGAAQSKSRSELVQVTPQAIERAERSMQAADVLHADAIAAQCAHAAAGEIVMAVVTPDLTFSSAELVALSSLREHIQSLQPGSWHLIFSPGVSTQEIKHRCDDMKSIASRRLAAMRRYATNHPTPPSA